MLTMDEMLHYIFKNMQNYDQEFLATARGFIAVKKCFKAQNKVNNLVTLSLCLFLVMHTIAYSDIKNLYERVAELEKEKNQNKGE
jgi:hypothetical protein